MLFAASCGPAELVAEGGGVGEGWGLHDFEVLLVLGGGAGGYFVEPLAGVVLEAAEAGEGGEELVVAVDAFGGDEGAHGEAVDEVVVEGLVVEGGGGGDFAFGAVVGLVVLGLDEADGVLAFGCRRRAAIDGGDAEAFARGFGDEGFGVDGAGEMHVQVGALGEGLEEGVEFAGAELCGGVEGAGGAGFAGGECGGGTGLRGRGGGTAEDRADEKVESEASADHAPRPFVCFEFTKDTAGGCGRRWLTGQGLALRRGVAILRVDVLEGAVDPMESAIPSPTGRRS